MTEIRRNKAVVDAARSIRHARDITVAAMAVNARASVARRAYLTDGAGQDFIYAAKEAEANEVLLGGDAVPTPFIDAEVGITAPDRIDVARIVIAAADRSRKALAAIEGVRLAAIAALRQAEDQDAVCRILETIRFPTESP